MSGFDSILLVFDDKQVRQMRDQFVVDLNAKVEEEKAFVLKKSKETGVHVPRMMTPEKYGELIRLAGMTKNAFQIEALSRLVFRECIIPTWKDVEEIGEFEMNKTLRGG